jgi:hypothetical protein
LQQPKVVHLQGHSIELPLSEWKTTASKRKNAEILGGFAITHSIRAPISISLTIRERTVGIKHGKRPSIA